MTNGTQGLIHGIISVSFFKRFLAAIMTAETERSFRFHQKIFLVRTVGEVARCTALLPHFMDYFLFIILFLMTLIASFISLRFQQVTELGSMGIMALNAPPSLERGMNTRLIHPYLIFTVAGIADFISFFLQNQFWNKTMAEDGNLRIFSL